jgi:hypothetical protein
MAPRPALFVMLRSQASPGSQKRHGERLLSSAPATPRRCFSRSQTSLRPIRHHPVMLPPGTRRRKWPWRRISGRRSPEHFCERVTSLHSFHFIPPRCLQYIPFPPRVGTMKCRNDATTCEKEKEKETQRCVPFSPSSKQGFLASVGRLARWHDGRDGDVNCFLLWPYA